MDSRGTIPSSRATVRAVTVVWVVDAQDLLVDAAALAALDAAAVAAGVVDRMERHPCVG